MPLKASARGYDVKDPKLAAEGQDLIDWAAREMPVNLGNPEEVTVLELAQLIVRLAGSQSQIEFRSLPVDDPKQRRPDITHARKLLGWQPDVPLEDGLARTLEYFRQVV